MAVMEDFFDDPDFFFDTEEPDDVREERDPTGLSATVDDPAAVTAALTALEQAGIRLAQWNVA